MSKWITTLIFAVLIGGYLFACTFAPVQTPDRWLLRIFLVAFLVVPNYIRLVLMR